jgi:uncharacterized protein (UPF0332 family)
MTPSDAVAYARKLSNQQTISEVEIRISIHLSYYAAFHFLCNRYSVSSATGHREVRDQLQLEALTSKAASLRIASQFFLKLRDNRKKADYRWTEPVRKEDAIQAVLRAEKILTI